MKILFVNTKYNLGSTGKLTKNFMDFMKKNGHEVYCIYADGHSEGLDDELKVKSYLTRKITVFLERLTGLVGYFSPIATLRAKKFIGAVKPDIIYLGNLHGYYINIYSLYKFIKIRNFACVQIMWDEFSLTGSCTFSFDCKKYETKCTNCPRLREYPASWLFDNSNFLFEKKKKSYEHNRLAFVSVPYTISLANKSLLLSNKSLYSIDEAIDQDKLFYPRDSRKLRDELGIPYNNKVILTVAVYPSERKGCKYFLELARRFENDKTISFVHVGFLSDKSECPNNYIPLGFVNDQELLATYYSLADLFVCTSFAETQPNTCLEALSCGTPICGFNISGIPTCASAPYGFYVEPKDVDALATIVNNMPKKTIESIKKTREYAESRFSSKDYNRRLLEVGLSLLNTRL